MKDFNRFSERCLEVVKIGPRFTSDENGPHVNPAAVMHFQQPIGSDLVPLVSLRQVGD
jgi:hypothetical protein